jgi:hypothetical protein
MKRLLFLPFVMLIALGCTTTIRKHDMIDSPGAKLAQGKTIYLCPVQDGSYHGKVYGGSGNTVFTIFQSKLNMYAGKIIDGRNLSEHKSYEEAKKVQADYIVKAVITNWEPRAAAFSGRPTRCEIQVSVLDVNSDKEIIHKKLSIQGRSMSFTNQSAEGLAASLINDFCRAIF